MSDPTKLDFADWFAVVATAILSGIGGAMAWFNSTKKTILARVDTMERSVDAHVTQLAVIHTNQDHITNRLEEIREMTQDTSRKLDTLMERIHK